MKLFVLNYLPRTVLLFRQILLAHSAVLCYFLLVIIICLFNIEICFKSDIFYLKQSL